MFSFSIARHKKRKILAVKYWNGIGGLQPGIQDQPLCPANGEQSKQRLLSHVHFRHVKSFKKHLEKSNYITSRIYFVSHKFHLSHFFPVDGRHKGLFGEQDGVLLRVDPEHVPEGVLPQEHHVVPAVHPALPQGSPHVQQRLLQLGLFAHVVLPQVDPAQILHPKSIYQTKIFFKKKIHIDKQI